MHSLAKKTYSVLCVCSATLWSWIAAVLSPPTCVGCEVFLDERVPLCVTCDKGVTPVISTQMVVTASCTMKIFAVSDYTGVIRSLIMAKQLGNRLPSKQLGYLIASRCYAEWGAYDYIIPVPLHWRRYAARGFNQSEEIAAVVSSIHNIPVSCGVMRTRATLYQTTLVQQARRQNVRNAFEITEHVRTLYRGKHLLLVDDVMTTGSTLREIARLLVTCRPASISVVVAARVILK